MKKKLIVLLFIFSLFLVVFSGCFEEKYDNEIDKFIGAWKAEDQEGYWYRAYNFFRNGTCYITTSELKGTYYVNEAQGLLVVNQTSPKVNYVFRYKFNYNYEILTLTNQENYEMIKYKRVK